MKKLLVVLLILVAGVLPGMAKECKDYRAAQGDLTSKSYVSYLLWGLIQDNDLKCLEYFVDEVHLNLNDVETRPGTSLIGETLALALSDTKLETVAFILNHGIKPTEGDMDYIARELTKMESQYNWRISNYGDLFLKKFELLTDKYPESLKMVDDYRIGYIIYYSVYSDNPLDLVEFLIDRGLPTIEYDRYISQTNKEMKEIYNNNSLDSYEAILENNRLLSVCRKIIALFEQSKVAKSQKVNDEVTKTVNDSLQSYPKSELHIDIINWDYK